MRLIYDANMLDLEHQTILLLANKCLTARKAADEARAYQLFLEKELLNYPSVSANLKDSGTNIFLDGFFKVITKINKKWDQKLLGSLLQKESLPIMPFDIEYKPNAARMKILAEDYPEAFKRVSVALTESPAKPYFTFAE